MPEGGGGGGEIILSPKFLKLIYRSGNATIISLSVTGGKFDLISALTKTFQFATLLCHAVCKKYVQTCQVHKVLDFNHYRHCLN